MSFYWVLNIFREQDGSNIDNFVNMFLDEKIDFDSIAV